jgi:hypothetical protein
MSIPIDDEVYGGQSTADPGKVNHSMPGRQQPDFTEPQNSREIEDPRNTDHPAGDDHAAENAENEPAG